MVDTTKLHPELLKRLTRVLAAMEAFGQPMRICQAARTAAEQHELWRQGRETPGPDATPAHPLGRIVTNCDGYKIPGPHQIHADGFSHATDCCFTTGEPFGDKRPWGAFGALAVAAGLKWGGNWTGKLVDRPHIELESEPITKP